MGEVDPSQTPTTAGSGPQLGPVCLRRQARRLTKAGAEGFHGTLHRVKTAGGDGFFVVLAFQRGEAPKVTVQGAGLDARVTVGGRTVRFDGKRIVIEQGPRWDRTFPRWRCWTGSR